MTTFEFVTIDITHEGRGLAGAVEQLHAAGYYATVVGSLGDVVIMYGPRAEHLRSRIPYLALIDDTITVSDRSAESAQQQDQQTSRQ